MTKPAGIILAATLLAAVPLCSQSAPDAPQPDDPPARVARLNWLTGDVAFRPAGLEDWTDATLNYPLTTGDQLVTGKDARVELHIGRNALRIDSNSDFSFLNLDDSIVQASITEGSLEIQVRLLDDGDSFEVATPNGAVTLLRSGDYRIDTDPDRDATMVTVRSGQAELYSGGNSMMIRAAQTAYVQGSQDPDVRAANDPDEFDSFVAGREGDGGAPASSASPAAGPEASSASPEASSVNPEVTGAEDLDAYGSWETVPQLGDVWVPPVDADWAPYSDGDWTYVVPWGWTWVDSAPWGFAPFHYGRWTFVSNHWVWIPGARTAPVVYAPALVAFFGGGSSGLVSWYALGPRERWIPPWRGAAAGTPLMSGYLANRNIPGAIRTLPQADFIAARHVHPGTAIAPEGNLLGSAPLLAPVRESVLAGAVRPHPPEVKRTLVARTPPPPAPILFSSRQGMLVQNQGRPLAAKQMDDLRRQAVSANGQQRPAVRASRPVVDAPGAVKPAPVRQQARPVERPVEKPAARTGQ